MQNDILNALFKKAYQDIDDIALPAAVTQTERLPPAVVTKRFPLILNVLVHIVPSLPHSFLHSLTRPVPIRFCFFFIRCDWFSSQ